MVLRSFCYQQNQKYNSMDISFFISDLNVKRFSGHFMKNNRKRQINKILEKKKIITNGNKLYVKWKGYDQSFNS